MFRWTLPRMIPMSTWQRVLSLAVVVATAVVVSGCSGTGTTASATIPNTKVDMDVYVDSSASYADYNGDPKSFVGDKMIVLPLVWRVGEENGADSWALVNVGFGDEWVLIRYNVESMDRPPSDSDKPLMVYGVFKGMWAPDGIDQELPTFWADEMAYYDR